MADKITFIMILHNHQPVGNFDWVFRNAANDAYVPFLDMLERHPGIKFGLHVSGPLLEWFAEEMPGYLDRVGELVKKGRLELLGGAFYEPILSILPDHDKIGQIEYMNRWLVERFGVKPSGCWLAERIWEPGLASIVGSCGITYTTLDNTHFQTAGLPDSRIWGSYTTDDQGVPLRVLPIDFRLRYLIPFHEPQETIDYIDSLKENGVTAVTYADDGEKFGVWPGTKKWVYQDGWLERFLTALEKNADWIDIVFPHDYIASEPPLGKVYLPTASYKEMMEWALPVEAQKKIQRAMKTIEGDSRFDDVKPFIRGGFWRNFLAKYPESDAMYRRMLMVSKEVDRTRQKASYRDAVRELYMAQCNCGYWHGVFGGLYLNFLRRAIYEHLIKAERLVATSGADVEVIDCNGDGYDEVVLENDRVKLFISPHDGGSAFEMDYFPRAFNLFDTFTRREEAYHSLIDVSERSDDEHASIHDVIKSKDKNILEYLRFDWYRRLNFLDHFMPLEETRDALAKTCYGELGDFVNTPYEIKRSTKKPGPSVVLSRHGHIRFQDRVIPVTVEKTISIPKKGALIKNSYSVNINGACDVLFGVEMNFGLQSGHSDDSFITIPGRLLNDSHLASAGEERFVSDVIFTVGWMPLKVMLHFSSPTTVWWFPVETVSLSEGGVERNYQNTCMVPVWRVNGANGTFTCELEMAVKS